jgi:hypothetical protein
MIKKIIFVMVFLSGLQNLAIASQPTGENIIIRNNSNKTITIHKKLRVGNQIGGWIEIEGLNVTMVNYARNIIYPNKEEKSIVIFPAYGLFENIEKNYYERLAAIPLVDKLNAIFVEFTITDAEGNILYDLAGMKEDDFIAEHNDGDYSRRYILEITD